MTISSTLTSSMSGLTAASRAAELVSSNIANAMTEGYGRRDLQLGSIVLGGSGQGVRVTGVTRAVDQALLSDRRIAEAGAGDRDARAAFLSGLEAALGTPETEGSLGARIAAFDASLIEAAGRPESQTRLTNVLDSARNLTAHIGAASDQIQAARTDADNQIALQVGKLNTTLAKVAEMNTQITAHTGAGRDASALMDQRQQLIDQIATIVPLREVNRDHGQIALYTTGGASLLDGRPATFGFTGVGQVTPDMTLASGALSGLTLNGRPVTTDSSGLLAGGTLAAHFAVRDELAPNAQTSLDAVARDLVERFADPALDATRAPGDPGLFTDAGAAFLPTNEIGLAQRMSVNAAVDPAQGGAVWRLRDGLGAAAPGTSGNSALLSALQETLVAQRIPVSGGFLSGTHSFSSLGADMLSGVASSRLSADAEASFATARATTLKEQDMQNGVDTDQELQKLLLIEQAYSANVRVMQTVDDMINTLLGL
ncbi:MAG: flagellar hook-associated protein FlgK [Paracoccaceae bacterium]